MIPRSETLEISSGRAHVRAGGVQYLLPGRP